MIKNNHFEIFKNSVMKTTFDKSRIMKIAWYRTKNKYGSFAFNLKKVWKEFKDFAISEANRLADLESLKTQQERLFSRPVVQNAEAMYNFYHGAGASEYKGD